MGRIRQLYLWVANHSYAKLARFYDPTVQFLSLGCLPRWRWEALDRVNGPKVLEIGFGTGELLIEMARRRIVVFGLEPSAEMLQVARTKLARNGLRIPCVRARAERMPFLDDSFDTVIATFPARYIFEPATLFEAARILRDADSSTGRRGGRLIVAGLGVITESRVLRKALKKFSGLHLEQWIDQFQTLASTAGFKITVEPTGGRQFRLPIIIAEKE